MLGDLGRRDHARVRVHRPRRRKHGLPRVDAEERAPPPHPQRLVPQHAPDHQRGEAQRREDGRVVQRLQHREPLRRREIELRGEQRRRPEGHFPRRLRLPAPRRLLGRQRHHAALHGRKGKHCRVGEKPVAHRLSDNVR